MISPEPIILKPEVEYEGFEEFAEFLKGASGIALTQNKHYLVAARIKKILEKYKLNNLQDLVKTLKKGSFDSKIAELRIEVIDAMTTNETYWFRDIYPFEHLKNTVLPELMESNQKELRIWSSACSSGQEAYSLSMTIEEYQVDKAPLVRIPVKIIGTDVSQKIMAEAKKGLYDKLSINRGLSRERLDRFFEVQPADHWRINSKIRSRVDFRALNLLDSYQTLGKFDVIFCRNVLIYFSGELKNKILSELHGSLKTGGYLCLGSSEGLSDMAHLFDMIHCNPGIFYRAK